MSHLLLRGRQDLTLNNQNRNCYSEHSCAISHVQSREIGAYIIVTRQSGLYVQYLMMHVYAMKQREGWLKWNYFAWQLNAGDGYQVSEDAIPGVWETEIEDNPQVNCIILAQKKKKIITNATSALMGEVSFIRKVFSNWSWVIFTEKIKPVHCAEIDRSGAFWLSVLLISVIKEMLREHLQSEPLVW